jgi:mono/diheme cytochrome c family protein
VIGLARVSRSIAMSLFALLTVLSLPGCDWELQRMIDQKRYDPYDPSEHFDDGMAMRSPPVGTVPRSRVIAPPSLTRGMQDGELVEQIPMDLTPALIERGRNRYQIFCSPCHGMLGNSNTRVAADMTLRPPPSLQEARIRDYPPGRIFRVISDGYGLMRSYAAELPIDDRWAVVAYVQALQLSQYAQLDQLPADLRQEATTWLK